MSGQCILCSYGMQDINFQSSRMDCLLRWSLPVNIADCRDFASIFRTDIEGYDASAAALMTQNGSHKGFPLYLQLTFMIYRALSLPHRNNLFAYK